MAVIKNNQVTFLHKDHLGSSTVTSDGNGIKKESTTYLPFGLTKGNQRILDTHYTFTDQEIDLETGLFNSDARFYDPMIAIFISADSIFPNLYNPNFLNRYSYVLNNPLLYVDPSGHYPTSESAGLMSRPDDEQEKNPVSDRHDWDGDGNKMHAPYEGGYGRNMPNSWGERGEQLAKMGRNPSYPLSDKEFFLNYGELKWVFDSWNIRVTNNWWSHYSQLTANCINNCPTGLPAPTEEVVASTKQWRPTPINTLPGPSTDYFGLKSPVHPVDATADLVESIIKAPKYSDLHGIPVEGGQKWCDMLP